jgi:hypothetical protein
VELRDVAQRQLDAVRAKLAELDALERNLSSFVASCTAKCAGGPAPKCSILEDLSQAQPMQLAVSRCCG